MNTETFDDKDAFLAAVTGKRAKRTSAPRTARVAKGEGDRLSALARLAGRGWVRLAYVHETGVYEMRHTDGRVVQASTYAAAIDAALGEM